MIRRLAALALLLPLAACAAKPATRPQTTGGLLARATCPERITHAEAWVNHQPGARRAPRNLVVSARMEKTDAMALLFKAADSTVETLVLDIRASETAPIAGQLAYREPAPDPMYTTIVFRCRGGEVFRVTQIERVF